MVVTLYHCQHIQKYMIKNKKIFITGGAGYLGKNIINRYYADNEIVVFSRDEAKHYYLKKQFPKVTFIIGDVRNFDLLKRASQGSQIGIFAASLKQIEAVDQNVEEALNVIVHGGLNSRRAAEENKFESACFISSDKSRAATTLYGGMKFIAGEAFIVNAERSKTKLSTAIYGNVLNSTGSVIPLIWDAIRKNYAITLYSPLMTRFIITVDEAIDLIETGLKFSGYNIIPNLKSMRIIDLFDIYSKEFGFSYITGTPRVSEKIHEMMISKEEVPRTYFDKDFKCYLMHYKNINSSITKELTSDIPVVSKDELYFLLQQHNYFK